MQNLPPEIVHAILAYVGLGPRAIRVCRQWRDLLCAPLAVRRHRQSPTVDDYMRAWARADATDTITWARRHGCPWSTEACTEAARRGNLSLFLWLRAEGCPWDNWACVTAAASEGHLDVITRIMADRPPLDEWICAGAAMGRQSAVIEWMHARGHLLDNVGACQGAARGGHLDLLIRLRKQGCPWNAVTCSEAAKGGHLDVLEWLRLNGCPWNRWTCAWAAAGGHLDLLMWAHLGGCPWDQWTCVAAAKGGHLECLRYARDNGCDWDERTAVAAATHGHHETLAYILADTPLPFCGDGLVEQAARTGDLCTLDTLRLAGYPWDSRLCAVAAAHGQVNVLMWAARTNCAWDAADCMSAAFDHKHERVAAWIADRT